jgi:membrane protein required for colicin V production
VNWVDFAVIGVVGVSALLALMRGFVREVLGIGAWIGAGIFARWAFPSVKDRFHGWISSPDMADAAAFGALFLASLIVLSVVSSMVGGIVRGSLLGGVDRTLGVVFGLLRGAVLVAFSYIAVGIAVPVDHWPPPVLEARTLPYAYQGAVWAVSLLPEEYRPVVRPPPGRHEPRAADLLHAPAQGRALGQP